jgi:hypothetical protein
MNKYDLFTKAMQAGLFNKLDWLVSGFALSRDNNDAEHYSWKITSTPIGYTTVDDQGGVQQIDDSLPGVPIFRFKEKVVVKVGDIPNCVQDTETTYGEILVNWILLVQCFDSKIPYIAGALKISKIENIIVSKFEATPAKIEDKKADTFYVDEYLKFGKACFSLTSLMKLSVWALTEKNMLPPDGLKEYKAKLLKENAGHLDDPRVISKISSQLVEYDAKWREGDEGNNFLISNKSVEVVRSRKFLMLGGEMNVAGDQSKMTLIENSLDEGWDVTKFPEMNNSSRMGSFSRGAETMLGGVEVKWMLRAASNLRMASEFCGTKLGITVDVTKDDLKHLVGFSRITDAGHAPITTQEEAGKYLGQRIMLSSPLYCKLDKTDYCAVCLGIRLSSTPHAIPQAVSAYGSTFMMLRMKAMHGKALSVLNVNIVDSLC